MFGEMYLPKQIPRAHDGHHSTGRRLVKEIPQNDTQQQSDREMGNIGSKTQETHKHQVHDREKQQRFEHGPYVSQERLLLAEFEISSDHSLKQDSVLT